MLEGDIGHLWVFKASYGILGETLASERLTGRRDPRPAGGRSRDRKQRIYGGLKALSIAFGTMSAL